MTVYNEPMSQPAEPENVDREGILRGMHLFAPGNTEGLGDEPPRVQLLASGVGVPWALEAQELLRNDWGVVADVWSVTSWTELRRDGLACDEQRVPAPRRGAPHALRHRSACARPAGPSWRSRTTCAQVQDQIQPWVPTDFASLGRRRVRLLRHPARGAAVLPHRRPVGRGARAADAGRPRRGRRQTLAREAAARYRLLDVTAGTSGNAGGDS